MGSLSLMARFLWGSSIALELLVLVIMTARRQYRQFPALYAYFLIGSLQAPVAYIVYAIYGYSSWPAYWTGWISQCVVVLARWGAVFEVCRTILEAFEGIWKLAARILTGLGITAMMIAVILSKHDFARLITTFDLGLEFSIACVLVGFFLFARYYDVDIQSPLRSMAVAFCLYSCFRALNDTILQNLMEIYASTWNLMDGVSYLATVILLASAMYVPRPVSGNKIKLLPRSTYWEMMPRIDERLIALNERLKQVFRSK